MNHQDHSEEESARSMHDKLKQLLFDAETIAHMRGFERQLLPLVDYVRLVHHHMRINEFCEHAENKAIEYLDSISK